MRSGQNRPSVAEGHRFGGFVDARLAGVAWPSKVSGWRWTNAGKLRAR
jgi:hypothetical protein